MTSSPNFPTLHLVSPWPTTKPMCASREDQRQRRPANASSPPQAHSRRPFSRHNGLSAIWLIAISYRAHCIWLSNGIYPRKTGIVDTIKPGLVMRMLCAHHIFSETALGVFANDNASTALATDERLANYVRYASFLFPTTDVLPSLLKDPVLCASYAPRDSALSKTIGKGMGQFEFLNSHPEWRDYFNLWLASLGEYLQGLTDVRGYPWEDILRNDAVVVNVGGGLGSSIQALRTNFPDRQNDLVGIVQDQPGMIEHATAHWQKTDPRALATGAVKLTTHDFFNENTVKGADVYWFRSVIVDWYNEDLITIFTRIKNAMTPGKSRLLIGVYMMHPTCGDTMLPNAPTPLLENYGEFQAMGLIAGFVITGSPNGCQRTLHELNNVLRQLA